MSHVVRKPAFCICENKDADQLRGYAKLISAFVFPIWIVQSLYYLNQKFQASNYLLWLYSAVCVRPGLKPRRPVFSQRGSNYIGVLSRYLYKTNRNVQLQVLSQRKGHFVQVLVFQENTCCLCLNT